MRGDELEVGRRPITRVWGSHTLTLSRRYSRLALPQVSWPCPRHIKPNARQTFQLSLGSRCPDTGRRSRRKDVQTENSAVICTESSTLAYPTPAIQTGSDAGTRIALPHGNSSSSCQTLSSKTSSASSCPSAFKSDIGVATMPEV